MHKKTDDHKNADEPAGRLDASRERLGHQLWQAQHAVERAMDEALRPCGVTLTQVAALMHLERQPGLSGAELARRLLITPQSTGTLLGRLEADRWIDRRPHAMHRGLIEIVLTQEGEAKLQEGGAVIAKMDEQISRGMSATERDQLGDLLGRCLANARVALSERDAGLGQTASGSARTRS